MEIELWEIIDGQTGQRVGKPYKNKSRARRRVDRLDNEYGAYRYQARPIGGWKPLAAKEV